MLKKKVLKTPNSKIQSSSSCLSPHISKEWVNLQDCGFETLQNKEKNELQSLTPQVFYKHKARDVDEQSCVRICWNDLFFLILPFITLTLWPKYGLPVLSVGAFFLPIDAQISLSKHSYKMLNALVEAFEIWKCILLGWWNITQRGVLPQTRWPALQPCTSLERRATPGTKRDVEMST